MNKERRKQIKKEVDRIESILKMLYSIDLESIASAEQDSFDNLPEGFQVSDRGTEMEDNIETLNDLIEKIDEIEDSLIEIQTDLEMFL